MTINELFNETDLYIFCRQNNFTFNDFFNADDGAVIAVDKESGQVFIGKDLVRRNVHPLSSVISTAIGDDDGTLVLSFDDQSGVTVKVGKDHAGRIVSLLGSAAVDGPSSNHETVCATPEDTPALADKDFEETYSRLINTGRNKAIGYLVSDAGMSVEEACKYVDDLAKQECIIDEEDNGSRVPDFNDDGTMTRDGLLSVLKTLKEGDMIHLEYKPLIGKLRVFDAEFIKLRVDVDTTRYFSMCVSGPDYDTLMEDLAIDLFDYFEVCFFHPEKYTDYSCHLKRVTLLRKLDS